MSLVLADLIVETRTILNEATAAMYSDAQITQWLQQAARDVALKTRCVEADATISVVSGTLSYAYPTGAFYISAVLNPATGLSLTKIDPQKMGHIVGTATIAVPLYYFCHNAKIYLTPIASSTLSLTALYAKSTESVLDILDEYRFYLIDYAVARGMMRNSQAIEALAMYNIWNGANQFIRQDVTTRGVTSIDELTIPDTKGRPQQGG